MTFEPAALAAGTHPKSEKPLRKSPGFPCFPGRFLPHTQDHSMVLSPAWHADPTPYILSPTLPWLSATRPPWTACPQNKCWDLTRTFISSMPVTRLHLIYRVCCSQPCKPCSPSGCQPPIPTARHLLLGGVSPGRTEVLGQAVLALSRCACPSPALRRLHGASSAAAGSSRHPSLGPGACCTHRPRSQRLPSLRQSPPPAARMRRAPGHSSSSIWSVGSGTRPVAPRAQFS